MEGNPELNSSRGIKKASLCYTLVTLMLFSHLAKLAQGSWHMQVSWQELYTQIETNFNKHINVIDNNLTP